MYNVTIFGIEMEINPVAFKLPIGENGWTIYWYGILIALGFALAMLYGYLNAAKKGVDVDRMLDVVLVATPCAILGARAYYVLFDPDGKVESISEFFGFNGGGISGLAILGGVIGAVIPGIIMAKIRKVSVFDLLDLAAVAFLIGQGIGRWGNFFNQEAFGGPTGSDWWGMTSENVVSNFRLNGYPIDALAHPCFLYESIWCLTGALVLHILGKKRRYSGETALMYCVWYGFGRAIIEPMRTDSLMVGNAKVSFLLSIVICAGAIIAMIVINKRIKIAKADVAYGEMFKDEFASEYLENIEEEEEPETQEEVSKETEEE